MKPEPAGKRVLVMGLGRFGGGVGVTRYLVGKGATVTVTDSLDAGALSAGVAALDGLDIRWSLGGHREEDFEQADWVVVNPAVAWQNNPWLKRAERAGALLTSEIQLLTASLPSRLQTIGITGTAGKSTVTAMAGHLLQRRLGDGRVWVGGNLGGSLLGVVDRIRSDDWVVLELSSFMLEWLHRDGWSPHIAALTNLQPNHLDRHGTFEAYARAKDGMFAFQQDDAGDVAVFGPRSGFEEAARAGWIKARVSRVVEIGPDDLAALDACPLLTPGRHNQLNACMATVVAGLVLGEDHHSAAEGSPLGLPADLADFPGLPHRLQMVLEHQQVSYYNDSKSTTPEATVMALEAFGSGRVHLIAGGYDKGADLGPMLEKAITCCRSVACIGTTGSWLAQEAALRGAADGQVTECGDLVAAVAWLSGRLSSGDVVLLSPGCASWDQFSDYEKRGAAFVSAVLAATGEGCRPVDEPK